MRLRSFTRCNIFFMSFHMEAGGIRYTLPANDVELRYVDSST
jgi:hypothetical protein